MDQRIRHWLATGAGVFALVISLAATADNPTPFPGVLPGVRDACDAYVEFVEGHDLLESVALGAKKIGVTIPGNMVVMVFHPKFAVRMLEASVPAGIEAPLRFYITENADGTTTLTYRYPSSVFAPYESKKLDEMARELDGIFAKIAADASS